MLFSVRAVPPSQRHSHRSARGRQCGGVDGAGSSKIPARCSALEISTTRRCRVCVEHARCPPVSPSSSCHPCRPAPAAILGRATQGCAAQGPVLAQGSHQTGKGSRSRARRSAAGARSTLEIGEKISRSGRAGSLAAAHRHAEKSRSAGGFRGARRSRIARTVDRRSWRAEQSALLPSPSSVPVPVCLCAVSAVKQYNTSKAHICRLGRVRPPSF